MTVAGKNQSSKSNDNLEHKKSTRWKIKSENKVIYDSKSEHKIFDEIIQY